MTPTRVSNTDRLPFVLHRDFFNACEAMIKAHYFEEVNWLWMASTSRSLCTTPRAREVLQRAAVTLRELELQTIAEWVERDVLQSR